MIDVFLPTLGGPSQDDVRVAKKVLTEHSKALDAQKSNALVSCVCGNTHGVSSLEYIQTHWYVEPYGCTGGDYWNSGEGQFKCPVSGKINRLYNSPEVVKLKNYFKSVKDVY